VRARAFAGAYGSDIMSTFGQSLVASVATTTAKHPLVCACGREFSPITLEKATAQGMVLAESRDAAIAVLRQVNGWPKEWLAAVRKSNADAIVAENACMVRNFRSHRGPGQTGALARALDAAAAK